MKEEWQEDVLKKGSRQATGNPCWLSESEL
jgi:hypothetical protein